MVGIFAAKIFFPGINCLDSGTLLNLLHLVFLDNDFGIGKTRAKYLALNIAPRLRQQHKQTTPAGVEYVQCFDVGGRFDFGRIVGKVTPHILPTFAIVSRRAYIFPISHER